MSKKELLNKLSEICTPIAESLNFELVDIEFVKEYGSNYLRVYIDKPGGITLDDCQNMSEVISERLDQQDPISGAYYLEVSSPGLDRPLKTDKDFKRNLGKEIEISLYTAIDNKKNYEGVLKDFSEKNIIITGEDANNIEIPRESVSIVKLALKF